MQFFRNANYDFMGKRWIFITLSTIANLICLALVFTERLNIGVDFAGGTQLTMKFVERPDLESLRGLLSQAGLGQGQIQRFGQADDNEVMIKTPLVEGQEEGSRRAVVDGFDASFNPDRGGRFDLNAIGVDALTSALFETDPDGRRGADEAVARSHYRDAAQRVVATRQETGLLPSFSAIEALPEISAEVKQALMERGYVGHFSVLSVDSVGPQVGAELRTKGILAVVFSIIGMLLYIWMRFELRFGIGAVVALVHDVLISLGAFALMGYEFNITIIAAFLTVVGYSVNDSVVVFDRVRENLRRNRRDPLFDVLNLSINQTLSRTILTSGTTLLAVGTLYWMGGDVIRGFAFVLLVGVFVGTYSTICVASPVVLAWERFRGKKAPGVQSRAAVRNA